MDEKSFLVELAELMDRRLRRNPAVHDSARPGRLGRIVSWFLPNGGTLILVALLIATQGVWARNLSAPTAASVSTIPYQGRLADAAGQPITARQNMEFRIYDSPTSSTPLWEEFWTGGNSVNVSDGLFSVMLGSINTGLAGVVQGHNELYLGITVGTDSEMQPRVQLGSVPFSMWSLTVADGSVTSAKIASAAITTTHVADGAVTQAKLGADVSLIPPDGSITTTQLADGAVTQAKIVAEAIGSHQIADGAITRAKAPGLIASTTNNTEIQYGRVIAQATETTGILTVDIDFAPDFSSLPRLILQPYFNYTAYVIANPGDPCDGTMCRVFLARADGGSWQSGQVQGVDWIAISQR